LYLGFALWSRLCLPPFQVMLCDVYKRESRTESHQTEPFISLPLRYRSCQAETSYLPILSFFLLSHKLILLLTFLHLSVVPQITIKYKVSKKVGLNFVTSTDLLPFFFKDHLHSVYLTSGEQYGAAAFDGSFFQQQRTTQQ